MKGRGCKRARRKGVVGDGKVVKRKGKIEIVEGRGGWDVEWWMMGML